MLQSMFETEEVEMIALGGLAGDKKELERGAASLCRVSLPSVVDELPGFAWQTAVSYELCFSPGM